MDAFEQWNYQAKDGTILTRDALEAVADTFDYHIDAEIRDVDTLEKSLAQAEAAWQKSRPATIRLTQALTSS